MTDAVGKVETKSAASEPQRSAAGQAADKSSDPSPPTDSHETPVTAASKELSSQASIQASNAQPPTPAPASKPETPSEPSKSASIPNRPEIYKSSSAGLANGHHDLPTRPEAPQARTEDRPPLPAPRDSRFSSRSGMDGPRDLPSGRGSERSMAPRGGQQMDDRLGRPGFGDGYARPLPRDARPLPPDDRLARLPNGRPLPDHELARRDFSSGAHNRGAGMAPPESTIPQHPDRAALIHGHPTHDRDQRGRFPPDYSTHANSDRRSRGPSPVRTDGRASVYDDRRPPADGRRLYDDRQGAARYDESHAPTGPRSDRPPGAAQNERFRESMRPPVSTAPTLDSSHGRLRPEPSSNRQSESYGRLNASNDVPSGPRLQNGSIQAPPRTGRNSSAQQFPSNSQQPSPGSQNPASPPPARQAPSGPAARSSPRNQPPPPIQSSSAPPTSSPQSPETAGIHPDRLKAIQGMVSKPNNAPPNRGGLRQPPTPISGPPVAPPRGPNSQMQSPAGSPPVGRGPPTGPADRSRGDKRFTNLQNVLQQSNGVNGPERSNQGTSIRGRGARANNMHSPSTSGPPTPGAPRPDPFPPRDDLFAGRPGGVVAAPPADDEGRYGRSGRRGPPFEDSRESERLSGRHRSRSAGKDRVFEMRVREDERPGLREDPRDRFRNEAVMNIRGNAGPDVRGAAPLSDRESRGGPPSRRGGRDEPLSRELDRRDSQDYGRRGDERERRDGSGSMRKRIRGGEDGFGERSMDSKRARR